MTLIIVGQRNTIQIFEQILLVLTPPCLFEDYIYHVPNYHDCNVKDIFGDGIL